METQQFPPSSPLIGDDREEGFVKTLKAGFATVPAAAHDELPTPNPSSSLGDVTNGHIELEREETVAPDTHVPSPLSSLSLSGATIIDLPLTGEEVRIGRSSLLSTVTLNSKNKAVSRLHLRVKYLPAEDLVEVSCIGYNGINVTIPALTDVHDLKDHRFLISVRGQHKAANEITACVDNSRVLDRTKQFTNFYMLRYESVKMPLVRGTVLDIRGEVLQLRYLADRELDDAQLRAQQVDLDDDAEDANRTLDDIEVGETAPAKPIEREQMVNRFVYKEATPDASFVHSTPNGTPLADKTFVMAEAEQIETGVESEAKIEAIEQVKVAEAKTEIDEFDNAKTAVEATPTVELATPVAPVAKSDDSVVKATPIETVVKPVVTSMTKPVVVSVDKPVESAVKPVVESTAKPIVEPAAKLAAPMVKPVAKPVSKSSVKPVAKPATKLAAKATGAGAAPLADVTNKRASPAPRGRPAKRTKPLTEEEQLKSMSPAEINSTLSTISQLEDLSNVITNYIAYSRILQTPFQSIRDLASVKARNLSKAQLRCILIHAIPCIGVIFREGKDAAGKPLDEEYYYVPENDHDQNRVKLVEDLKGSSSHIRSCRKTHKQYFWKRPK